jgi:hypothetical protein
MISQTHLLVHFADIDCEFRLATKVIAQTEPFYDTPITGFVLTVQICQVPPSLAYQLEQAAPRVFIVFVDLEMLNQFIDASR